MVVIAQLAEHRIVVPSVVGSSPTLHPKESHTALFSFAILTKKEGCLTTTQPFHLTLNLIP